MRTAFFFFFFFQLLGVQSKEEQGTQDCQGSPDQTMQPPQNGSHGRIVVNSGEGPVQVQGNGSGREQGTFPWCRYFSFFLFSFFFFYGLGLNFDSEMIYTSIHQQMKEMIWWWQINNKHAGEGGSQLWVGYGCAVRSFDHHPITKPEKMQICNL